MPIRRRGTVRTLAAACLLAGCGFSYTTFNTMHIANDRYDAAEKKRLDFELRNRKTASSTTTTTAAPKLPTDIRKEYEKVLEKCGLLIDRNPASERVPEALYLMARSFLAIDELDRARTKCEELLAEYPDSRFVPRARVTLAEVHLALKDNARALALLQEIAENGPEEASREEAEYLRGRTLLQLERRDEAEAVFAEYLGRHAGGPREAEVRYLLGTSLLEAGFYPDARRVLAEVKDRGEGRWAFEARFALARTYVAEKNPAAADAVLERLEEAATLDEERARVQVERARLEAGRGDLDRAEARYQDIVTRYPAFDSAAEAQYRLGLLYLEGKGDVSRASTAFEKVRALAPRSSWNQLALQRKRDLQKLTEYQGRLRSGNEDPAEPLFLLAEHYLFQLEDARRALGQYREVFELHGESALAPRALLATGWILEEKLSSPAGSEAAYALLRERYPESEQALEIADRVGPRAPGPEALDALLDTLAIVVELPPDSLVAEAPRGVSARDTTARSVAADSSSAAPRPTRQDLIRRDEEALQNRSPTPVRPGVGGPNR